MVERGLRVGVCYVIHKYATAKSKYMKGYKKDKKPSFLMSWDSSNLYVWAMFQKLLMPVFNGKKHQHLTKS